MKRFKEPSTWAGAAAIIAGAGLAFGNGDAIAVAQSVSTGGEMIANGQVVAGISAIFAGLLGVIIKEKGAR